MLEPPVLPVVPPTVLPPEVPDAPPAAVEPPPHPASKVMTATAHARYDHVLNDIQCSSSVGEAAQEVRGAEAMRRGVSMECQGVGTKANCARNQDFSQA